MKRSTVLLVNPNRMRPPIGPIGLEYVAASLARQGYEPLLCDLTFAEDWRAALTEAVVQAEPLAVGVSVRNVDDAYFASQDFVLEETAAMVHHILQGTEAPVVLGGVGFSSAPKEILNYTGATYGLAGENEEAFARLLDALMTGTAVSAVPGVVFRDAAGNGVAIPPEGSDLPALPTPSRRYSDNARYFAEGGQAGVETKRGCNRACIYCVEPKAKGRALRLRSPESVAEEFADLLEQGIDAVHLCDSEFNLPPEHAHAVCEALVRSGIGPKVRWYTYACPHPFDEELARAMARAGCVGVNFGIDHGEKTMLRRLGRGHGPEDIHRAGRACREAGLTLMLDMLLGSPGETRETMARGIELARTVQPDCVGLSCGVRVYPHTPLARIIQAQGPLKSNPNLHGDRENNDDFLRPIFYVDAALGEDIHRLAWSLIGGDKRFMVADPKEVDRNYNYNDNSVLAQAIRSGQRGAYWDILRRVS